MNDAISIHLLCHSLGSLLRVLLRLVKVLLDSCSSMAFQDTLLSNTDYRLGWLRNGSDGAFLLLRLLLRAGCVHCVEKT
jgi:hypothetical protein